MNIFSHYRPAGDPLWYTRENPPGTPEQLVDVGKCHTNGIKAVCDKASLPSLSPTLEVIKTASDLYDWWVKVSPSKSSLTEFRSEPDL